MWVIQYGGQPCACRGGNSKLSSTMVSGNIKAIEEMRKKNDKSMIEKADLASKLKRF